MKPYIILFLIGLLGVAVVSQAQSLEWGAAGTTASNGILNASLIPATTGPGGVRFTNVNGQGYDVVVITSGFSQSGPATLPWNYEPGWYIEGAAAASSGNPIPYSTVEFHFYRQGTNVPIALTGAAFSFEDAEVGERLRGFQYWNAAGNEIALSFTTPGIFTYASGSPDYYQNDQSVDSGSPSAPGIQEGKWIDVNLAPLAITGFTFQAGRANASYGSIVMTALGVHVPTGELLVQNGADQNISAGPAFVTTSSSAILTPASLTGALDASGVTVAPDPLITQDFQLDANLFSSSGNSLSMGPCQDVFSPGGLFLSSTTGNAGTISLIAFQSVVGGPFMASAASGAGGDISIDAGNNIGITGGIDSSASTPSGQGGDITLEAGNTLTADTISSGGEGDSFGSPGDITLTASNTITVGNIYDDSGSGAEPQATVTAPYIALGQPGGLAADIGGTLSLQKPASASAAYIFISGTVTGPGGILIDAGAGAAYLGANATYTGETDIRSGLLAAQGYSLDSSDVVIESAGAFRPGVTAPGRFVAVNSLTLDTNATLGITLTGSSTYDQIQAAAGVSLDGVFNLSVAPGFAPAMGEAFQVLTFPAGAGNFAEYQGLRLSDRLLEPVFTDTSMSLVTIPIPTGASQPLQPVPAGGLGVAAGGAYDGLSTALQFPFGILAATLIDGTASQAATVTMSMAAPGSSAYELQGSLGGTLLSLLGTGTDKIVVQLDYNQAAALAAAGDQTSLFLASSSGGGAFVNAVLANADLPGEANNPTEFFRAYNPATDFHLGYYGIDTITNRAWAVVDYDACFGLGSSNVSPSPAGPAAATEAASGVFELSSTLNGLVNSNGFPTTAVFESGTSPTLAGASVSPVVWSGSAGGFVQASCPLAGLAPATAYYFRIDAITTSGTEYGGILSFTTLSNPVASESGSTNVTNGVTTLDALVNPQGLDTTAYFQFGTTAAYGSSTTPQDVGSGNSAVPVSALVPGLLPNTTYHYKLVTTSAAGTFSGPDETFTTAASPVSIALSQVGNPVNVPDPLTGYGEVDYAYDIGTFDVTLNQYAAFLNAVATQSDPYGLYMPALGTDKNVLGILRSGSAGNYSYSVIGGSGNDPVTYVSWLDAARFCNWLQNGQPATGVENAGATETGAYLLNGDTTSGLETRQAGAQWWVPGENEWYKAAYYDPTLGGAGGYWLYPTRGNSAPGNVVGGAANEANYFTGLFSVTQSEDYSTTQNYLTPVGSFTNSASYYGTCDQGGDVTQWNDAIIGSARGQRGGDWGDGAFSLQASYRPAPYVAGNYTGFRVATLDSPTFVANTALNTGSSVTFSANVNPRGFAGPPSDTANVYVSWQYGLAAGSYTQATAAQPIGTGTSATAVTFTLPAGGLTATIYHYRLLISSTLGNTRGPDQTFSEELPTVAYDLPAITGTTAALSISVNPEDLDTTVLIRYGLSTAYTSGTTPARDIGSGLAPVSLTVNLASLVPYTTYHFCVVTSNILGTVQGPDQVFTTGPAYAINPPLVTGSAVTFSASVNPDGCAGPAGNKANQLVSWQYGLVEGDYTLSTPAQPVGTGTSAVPVRYTRSKAGLQAAIYHYRMIISSNPGLTYGPDQTFSFERPSLAYSAPASSATGAVVSFTINPNDLDTHAFVEYGLTTAYGSTISLGDIGSGAVPVTVSGTLSGLAPDTAYYYRVVTTNVLGTIDGAAQLFATQPAFGTAAIVLTGGQAPGIAGATWKAFGNPAINDSDHVAFQGSVTGGSASGIVASNNSGIWADIGAGGLTLIARTGNAAPGYTGASSVGKFTTLSDPVYADDDAVAFLGTLAVSAPVTRTNDTGIWATTSGTLALVARAGDPAPNAIGAVYPTSPVFSSFSQFVLPDQGGVIILANLLHGTNGVGAFNDQGLWAVTSGGVLEQILCKGDSLIVRGVAKTVSALSIFNAPAAATGQTRHFDSSGDLAYKLSFTDGSTSVFTVQSLSNPAAIFSKGDLAPGSPAATFSVFGNPAIHSPDHAAFQATVTGTATSNSGIWADIGTSGLTQIARTGTTAPDYTGVHSAGTFSALSDPVYADDDAVAFIGALALSGSPSGSITRSNDTGIWATTSGTLALVARTGDLAPDTTGTVSLGGPVFASFSQLVLPDQGGVVFLATLVSGTGGVGASNNKGLWAVSTGGVLTQILRTGDALNVNGKVKSISNFSIFIAPAASTGQTRHFNNAGDLLYKVSFTDGSTALVQSVFP